MTALRGIAAITVVLFHARGSWHPIFSSGERFSMFVANGWLWVHFFFVLSGFVMMEAYGANFSSGVGVAGYRRFVGARFARIYPLHLAVLAAMAVLASLDWIDVLDPPGSFAASLLLVQGFAYGPFVWNAPAWSISTEWYVYLVFPFVVPLLLRASQRTCGVSWVVLSVVSFVSFARLPSPDEWPAARLLLCLNEFLLGCATRQLVVGGGWPRIRNLVVATIVLVVPFLLMALPERCYGRGVDGVVAVWFAISIAVVASSRTALDRFLMWRPLQFLGLISYSVYLNHELVYECVKRGAAAFARQPHVIYRSSTGEALLLYPVFLATLLVVSWATWRWIEEPPRAWYKRRLAARRPVGTSVAAPVR